MKLSTLQKKVVAFILLVACINLFMGCHRYFKPVRVDTPSVESKQTTLKNLSGENRYFILRKGMHSYALSNLVFDQARMTLTADVGDVPPEHELYLKNKKRPKYIYSKARHEGVVLKEVHLFTGDTSGVDMSKSYTFPIADVQKIDLIEFDKHKTSSSYTWGTIGLVLGVALTVAIIAAATYTAPAVPTTTISSCPYISTFDGQGYKLQGEIYSAAIYPSLQKDDYLPLQVEPLKGEYRIKISNELQEIQHTDFADLMVVEHDKNVKILVDPAGKIYSISAPQLPVTAMLNNRIDASEELRYKDNKICHFKDDNGTRSSEDLFITFKNDLKSKHGKLLLSTKTSSWLNYLYGEFTKGFGSNYNKWAKEQEKKPASELNKWSEEQNIPLTVSVKTAEGWVEIQKISPIGPLLNRDIVVPVDLPAGETAEFKISGGYMFWELDYAAIDYSPNTDFTVSTIKPYEAINEKGANVLADMLSADKKYLSQPDIGDSTILKYKSISKKEGMDQTVFLHSSGYYKYIRDFKGSPKVGFLKSFNQPGALAAFSRQKFSEVWNSIATTKN